MIPLFDEDAERAVLGALLIRNEAIDEIADVLVPADFGRLHHEQLYRVMLDIHRAGRPIDPITIAAEVARQGLEETVTMPFVTRLTDVVPRSTNVLAYAHVVKDKALVRQVRDTAQQVLAEAEDEASTGEALLERAEAAIYQLASREVPSAWVSGADWSAELYPTLERMQQERRAVSGVPTGFSDLDEMTRGFQPGDLVLLGARPSMGKTAICLQMALHAAQRAPVAFFSLEMSREALGLRAVTALSCVDGQRLMSGYLSDSEYQRVGQGLAELGDTQVLIDDSPALSPHAARSKLRRMAAQRGALGLVVIDYLQLMACLPEDKRENKTNQVAGISRALKLLARELKVPFLVLSQLNRGLERSTDKRPTMADLRDSGALEQDADLVLLLHRPEVYDTDDPSLRGIAQLIVGKQRNGPTGTVTLTWLASQTRFADAAPSYAH